MTGDAKPMKTPKPIPKTFLSVNCIRISEKPQSGATKASDKERSLRVLLGFQIFICLKAFLSCHINSEQWNFYLYRIFKNINVFTKSASPYSGRNGKE